jgi:(R,R)-butanediol dehydrogenase/meso-butanediol dehydrogenase/diacetyl reductase
MKAAVWYGRRDIRVEEFPDPPPPGENEVKIQVAWCGICGTDLEEYLYGPLYIPVNGPNPLTGRMAPMILGHEFAGTVVEVGPGVNDFKVGDVITPDTLIHCGECYWCRRHYVHQCEKLAILGLMTDGGFAEYVNAPTYMCFHLPPGVSPEVGALAEPASVAVRANRLAGTSFGDRVAVIGAGTIGLLCMQTAFLAGASEVYVLEVEASRREVASRMGATQVLNPPELDPVEAIKDLTGGHGVDVVLEAGGNSETIAMAPKLARKRGRVALLTLHNEPVPINFFPLVCDEIQLIGSFSHIYDEDFAAAVSLLGSGRIQAEPLITGRIGLDDVVEKGLEELLANKAGNLKILVSPQEGTVR